MNPITAQEVAAVLKQGRYPDAPLQLIKEGARLIADNVKPPQKFEVRLALDVLRKHRHFDLMHMVGSAWRRSCGCDPVIQQHLVQSVVELGGFDWADELLDEIYAAAAAHPKDQEYVVRAPEYHGLRGRIRKQRYVHTGDVNYLVEAVESYQHYLSAKPSYYLAVNVLALRTRLHDLGLDTPGRPLTTLARDVLRQAVGAARTNPNDPWAFSTISEACLALDRLSPSDQWYDNAELGLFRFLSHPKTGPFEVESYFRQVREIWDGNPLDSALCAGRLATIFERYLMRTQQRWSVDSKQLQRLQENNAELEKNFSGEKGFSAHDIRKMLAVTPNVGCVTDGNEVRMGTGFLMPGATFGIADQPLVFVTNAHVIGDVYPDALRQHEARVTFEIEAGQNFAPATIEAVLFTSEPGGLGNIADAPGKLDVTVCRLSRTPGNATGLSAAAAIPLPSPRSKAFVVGHPRAGEMQFSLQDSVLMDVCWKERLMHYRTPTDPGSSGSPVFNRDWDVVALHHAGSQTCPRLIGNGTYEANEGITLHSIRRAMGVAI